MDPTAPGEELTVKRLNLFSERFDFNSSAGCARSGTANCTGSYTATHPTTCTATCTGSCVPARW